MADSSSDGGSTEPSAGASILATWQLLRASSDVLAGHAAACIELLIVEWQEERGRLLQMVLLTVVATACLLLLIGFSGLFMLAAVWETRFRVPVAGGLLLACALGAVMAWRKTRSLNVHGPRPFAAFREELAKDLALAQMLRKRP